jgi:hypothetical protein
MIQSGTPYHFHQMKRKYQWIRAIEIFLWSFAIAVLLFFVLRLISIPPVIPPVAAVTVFVISAFIASRYVGFFNTREKDLALYLNRHYAALQESADLLLVHDGKLTPLQQLQKRRVIQQFEKIYPNIKLPHHLGRAATILLLSISISAGLTAFSARVRQDKPASIAGISSEVDKKTLPATMKNSFITILPPSYTGIKGDTTNDFNLKIPEGATVEWRLAFSEKVKQPKIILSTKDSLTFSEDDNDFRLKYTFSTTGFYHIVWRSSGGDLHSTDYFKIDVVKDQPPNISIDNPNQFLEIDTRDHQDIALKVTLTDDYGLKHANIIATVSKGTGEAIKFREEKLMFDQPKKIAGKKILASRHLNLRKLGLEPGDELYFYIEATDIKMPVANQTRTETYFIVFKDTSSQVTSVDGALGVDVMPDYFRSQRQIIIDTEKLLSDKKGISKQNFNERSNALAHDQKLLRLRYGEFLGEEFVSHIGPQATDTEEHEAEEDVEKKFGHAHDTDNEHHLVDEKETSHNHKESVPGQKEDPAKAYVHAHDIEEEATFFTQSIRAKLKAAITIMWDAELHLRLYHPEKSLPYQYKALKLLKEISQDSRIYVHRTGFDPPPLKEEKRLTGDLNEIRNSTSSIAAQQHEPFPNIRAGVVEIETLLTGDSIKITAAGIRLFTNAGQELASMELKTPGRYLQTLSLLKQVTQREVRGDELRNALIRIKNSFSQALPWQTVNPQSRSGISHPLDVEFLKKLEASRQHN